MTDKEIEVLAKKGTPLPEGATLADSLFYHCLRLLYREYRDGILNRDQAKLEKSRLVNQFGVQKLWERCGQNEYDRRRRMGALFVKELSEFWTGGIVHERVDSSKRKITA